MKIKQLLIFLLGAAGCLAADAARVQVNMNKYSTTMTLIDKETRQPVETGEPTSYTYNFETPAGEYVLTGFNTDGTVNNGSIDITITDSDDLQTFSILTCTAYVNNKNENGVQWSVENGDYTIDVTVCTKEGASHKAVMGNSTSANRYCFLVLNGNSYYATFIPSETHQSEGYMTLYKAGTVTNSIDVSGTIPTGETYSVEVPADAELQIGMKFSHFTDFTILDPQSVDIVGDGKRYTYKLAYRQVYNYRTWREGGLTQGGYFTMAEDATKRPELKFTDSDYKAFDPKQINHDVKSNLGYETGNIFVNINERGHLKMNKGDKYDALALRSWELTDNSTSNYFIEPDFHYTVIGLDGKPSTGVIEITQTPGSAWADIKAVGNGTAIVLVTYDAIGLNYYRDTTKQPYLGGEYWGAIWPENTGVYIVTVGDDATGINPNMILNEKYNEEAKKVAGKYVDAEHDVFYYLDTEDGAVYTFTPEGVDNVTIAYPSIGERMATYTGFRPEGVTKNEDGSYTVVLKSGRNIVKLTDATGKSVYQILNAKSCHREITNASREGSKIFQPGDQVKIQYSGLHHPANKLAGIYNMSAYVTYNNIPNGSAMILGSNQYTFGSSAGAQAVTVTLPQDIDVAETPELVMNEGVIQVNGYGDPIGNHRAINRNSGRNANFTAIAHKTYFGYLPDVKIPLTAYKEYVIRVEGAPDGAEIMLTANGKELTPAADGSYRGTYGSYRLMLSKPGYRCYRNDYLISDEDEGDRIFKVEPVKADGTVWDGKSMTEPQQLEDVYQIGSPEELAWFADNVSVKGNREIKGCLTADIDLGDYEWTTPIGGKSTKSYQGIFDGQGYHVTGLYISNSSNTYSGLFGNTGKAAIKNITVSGEITGGSNIGGIVGTVGKESTIDRCVSNVLLKNGTYSGGIAGYLGAKAVITNCYNTADVDGRNAGGICGLIVNGAIINNSFNLGHINGSSGCGAIAGYGSGTADNCFATTEYPNTKAEYELVSDAQMRSGEVAYKLGEAFGQNIGKDEHPVIGGMKVLYNETADTYYNDNGNISGIADIKADEAEGAVYYNLHGVASDRAFKGLNIIRLSNGSVHKVFVK